MSTNKIFFKTMGFMWMKLGLGLLTAVISLLWGGLLFCIGRMFTTNIIVLAVLFLLWVSGTATVSHVINYYIGYLVKAGHVAIIATAVTSGTIPERQFETAKGMVKERFVTSNVYFVIDKLVSKSVSQIQGVLQKADSFLGGLPGLDTMVSILQIFVKVALDYVDECCLGYTFVKNEDSACKSAADGVVIYVQNWKVLLKNSAVTTAMVILMTFLACILPFLMFGAMFTALSWPRWIAFILAVLVAFSVKYAFIDSFMMIKTMVSYMQVAQTTEITFDLYGKLCGWSDQFKELMAKAKEEGARMFGKKRSQVGEAGYQAPGNQQAASAVGGGAQARHQGLMQQFVPYTGGQPQYQQSIQTMRGQQQQYQKYVPYVEEQPQQYARYAGNQYQQPVQYGANQMQSQQYVQYVDGQGQMMQESENRTYQNSYPLQEQYGTQY